MIAGRGHLLGVHERKRENERVVTKRARDNPVLVEDLVRNVALRLKKHP